MTVGEYRVGINFNPSNDDTVGKIKRMAADLIDAVYGIEDSSMDPNKDNERKRLKALAMTHIEDAAMWAVKAATKQ
jgi:hypothetical protein